MSTDRELLQRIRDQLNQAMPFFSELVADIDTHLKEPVQEPVAWRHSNTHCLYETEAEMQLADADSWAEPLYLAALPQPAVPDEPSDDQLEQIFDAANYHGVFDRGFRDTVRSILNKPDPGAIDDRAWPFREPL